MTSQKMDADQQRQKPANPDQLSEEDKRVLERARNTGSKLSLREALGVEGRFADQPLVGVQAMHSEISLTPQELLTAAASHGQSAETAIAASLTPDKKQDLLTQTIKLRPEITVGEVRAVCGLLQVDAKPFVDKVIKERVQEVKNNVDEAQRTRDQQKVIQTFIYRPHDELVLIRQQYANERGRTVEQDLQKVFRREQDRLALDLALLGKLQSRADEFERLLAKLRFEEDRQARVRLLVPRPMSDGLRKARKKMELARLKLGEPEGEDDAETASLLQEASETLEELRTSGSFLYDHPELLIGVIITAAVLLLLFLIGGRQLLLALPLVIGAWAGGSVLLWHVHTTRLRKKLVAELSARSITESQRRITIRARTIKKRR